MSKKKAEISKLDKILNNFFDLSDIKKRETAYENLQTYFYNNEYKIEKNLETIKNKLENDKYKKYISEGDTEIYACLFNIFKEMKIDFKNNIFFTIIKLMLESQQKEKIGETMKKIIRIIHTEKYFMLKNFEKLFGNIIIPLLEKKKEIRNKAYYLDQIMKVGIGNIYQTEYNNINKKTLDNEFESIYKYLIYLIKNLKEKKPIVNALIISWFNFLETLPGKDLNDHYKEIIESILKEFDLKNEAESELTELYLKKIINNIISSYDEFYKKKPGFINDIVNLIIISCEAKENHIKRFFFGILNKFLQKFDSILDEYHQKNSTKIKDKELIEKIPFQYFPRILKVIIEKIIKPDISDVSDIRDKPDKPDNLEQSPENNELNKSNNSYPNPIHRANSIFSQLMKKVEKSYIKLENAHFNFEKVIKYFLPYLKDEENTNLVFDWITQLYESNLFENPEELKNLINSEDMTDLQKFHIKRIIGVITMLNKHNNIKNNNEDIINIILKKFQDIEFIKKFGIFIINELSETIKITEIFYLISKYQFSDFTFVKVIIQLLTEYLTTDDKAKEIISTLNFNNKFFKSLYNLFCYNPSDTLVLLLLSKSFELSYFFVLTLIHCNSDCLNYEDLSKTVEVFESPIFTRIRIQLLNPKSNIYLVKTLYAISLLLPPGPSLNSLNCRLKCLEVLYDFDENEYNINEAKKRYKNIKQISKSEEGKEMKIISNILDFVDEKDRIIFKKKKLKEYIYKFLQNQNLINNFIL